MAFSTARARRGRTRPRAAADSSESWSRVAAASLGITRVWPEAQRKDVEKGQDLVVLIDLVAGDLAPQDLREDGFGHSGFLPFALTPRAPGIMLLAMAVRKP